MNVIETHQLSRRFWRVQAVRGLDLEVPEGSIYAFLGPNGAGKTTTLKMLLNLLRPSSGEAVVLGTPSQQLHGRSFERIGYVAEEQELPERMTVRRFFAYLEPFYPTWDRELAGSLQERLRLPLDRKLAHLSRGMKMKAKLVSSLAYRPKLLILDEPFSGLDPMIRDELLEGILTLGGEDGTTVLIASHDLAEVENVCSHVAFLAGGRLRLSEERESLHERFREVEVVFQEAPETVPKLPAEWLEPQMEGRILRFVDSHFELERVEAELRERFPSSFEMNASAMTLREIFLSLARAEESFALEQPAARKEGWEP